MGSDIIETLVGEIFKPADFEAILPQFLSLANANRDLFVSYTWSVDGTKALATIHYRDVAAAKRWVGTVGQLSSALLASVKLTDLFVTLDEAQKTKAQELFAGYPVRFLTKVSGSVEPPPKL